MAKFKTIITTAGAAKIAAVLAGTSSIVLNNTAKMAVGDGGGTLPTPSPSQTKLVREVHRAPINRASIDASDPKNIVAELVIPPETGGFWLREMALYDAAGTLLAVGNMAETYKPSLSEGAGRKMVIRMVIAVSEISAITITMDTTTVMATQDYVDSEIDKHAKSRNHPDATLTAKGFTQLSSSTTSTSETLAATPKAVKVVKDATDLKAPLASPALTGTPTAPTAQPGTNNQQIANTQYVQAAITALLNSAPGVLDTLGELATALGNDANFATTMANALAAKAPLSSPALTGKPTAPTASQTSNDTQLATTEFVTRAVSPALLVRGGIPDSSNLNDFGPTSTYIGVWGQSSVSATAADIANGYPAAERGVLEVFPGGRNNGTQRYTTDGGRFFIRWLTAAWNASSPSWSEWIEIGGLSSNTVLPATVTTLSDATAFAQNQTYVLSGTRTDSPVGLTTGQSNAIIMSVRRAGGTIMGLHQTLFTAVGTYERYGAPNTAKGWTSVAWYPGGDANGWRLVGADALAAIGYGTAPASIKDPFDWQQIDMVTGEKRLTTYSATAWLNTPAGITYNSGTNVDITCVINQANRIVLRLTSNAQTSGNRAEYVCTGTGAKGSRNWTIVQNYNSDSSTVIPVANGGTGASTPAGARANLGFDALGIGIASQVGITGFDWQQADFVTAQNQLVNVTGWLNAPSELKNPAGDVVNIACEGARNSANRFWVRVTSQSMTASARYEYFVVINGAKGNRTFNVVQEFNSDPTTVIPLSNGGLGANTPAGGRKTLGFDDLGIGVATQTPAPPFDWQQADFVTGQKRLVGVSSWINAPTGLRNPANDILDIECILANANRFVVRLISQYITPGAAYVQMVTIDGAKGSRTFKVTQEFNSDPTTVIPIVNGGTGGKTIAEALENLGLGPIATDSDIQGKSPKKLVDAAGLINAISTLSDVQNGELRKFVNALTLKTYLPTKALPGNGFIRIPDVPGGTIIQYGQVSKVISEGIENVQFPTPFPNSCRFAIAIPINSRADVEVDIFAQINSLSSSGVNFMFSWATSSTPADGFQWFALGY